MMKERTLSKLGCCNCGSALDLRVDGSEADAVISGSLSCPKCETSFPIRDGIPRILPVSQAPDVEATAGTFGYEWEVFQGYFDFNRDEFLDLIRPFFSEQAIAGKTVLDAGCGSGMYSRFFGEFGADDIVLLDLSTAIEVAQKHIDDPHFDFVQGDIIKAPFREETFDLILSKGVLHHLPDPQQGFRKLLSLLREGGGILFWVYGSENNSLLARYSSAIRTRFFSKLSFGSRRKLAWVVAAALYVLLKVFYHPTGRFNLRPLKKILPNFELFYQQSHYPFKHIHFGCFDHFSAPIAYYLSKEDLEQWMKECNITDFKLVNRWRMSWSVFARKTETVQPRSSLGAPEVTVAGS